MALSKKLDHSPVKAVHFTFQANLLSWYTGSNTAMPMPILKSGKWDPTYISQSRFDLVEYQENMPHGPEYSYKLQTFLPGNFRDMSAALSALAGMEHLLMITFDDDTRIVLGSLEGGADFNYTQSLTEKGAELKWNYKDCEPATAIEWIEQFFINQQGQLESRYQDVNTYTLTNQGIFSGVGPTADLRKLSQTKLISI